jgi:hemerythrin-like domain-containing protein
MKNDVGYLEKRMGGTHIIGMNSASYRSRDYSIGNHPQRKEVGWMRSLEYMQREQGNVESLLEMLDHSILRIEKGKDVPPYMLKEIIELLQIYIDVTHRMREELLLTLLGNRGASVPSQECAEIHHTLKKHERFLLRVVEAYDLGYQGAKGVFAHYASQYIAILRQHQNELLTMWVEDHEQRDGELLKEFKKIDGGVKRTRERGLIRMETLKREMRTVAA